MSTLTRQHFEILAAALRAGQPKHNSSKLGYHLAISAVANGLAQINPKFDRDRFVRACCAPGEVAPTQRQLQLLEESEA